MFLIPRDYWTVRTTKKKGRGIFAKKDIKAGTIIGDYLGKVVKGSSDEIDEDAGLYLMYYHDRACIYPEHKSVGIHLLNNSCTPNCWMYTYRGHTLFFTLRDVFKGEELTISYLLDPIDTCKPCIHQCSCGSDFCEGTMHLPKERYDKWADFHEKEDAATKRVRIRYGKELPKLDNYPKEVPDKHIYTLFGFDKKPAKVLKHKSLPKVKEVRKIIRETGRTIELPHLNLRIYGVLDGKIVSKSTA